MTRTPQIQPQIQIIPLRDAVGTDTATTQDVLLKILPPEPDGDRGRPPLNLGLVIDRSGSMQGEKIQYARQAAVYAVEQLLPSDRISVTIYDDRIKTLVPSTLATQKSTIIRQIQNIQPRNATALHAGWVEGGVQVSQHLNPQHLNRIILLSDGLANRGETNPDVIASDVRGLAKRGVSTTTMGVGDDYNEDLLESMANCGDGNYYYIDSPEDLPDIFGTELQGLIATCGRNVRLRVEPQGDVGLLDVFNDFKISRQGEYQLPNLVLGNPFIVALRLKVPPQETSEAIDLCHFRLSWDDPDLPQRQTMGVSLQLPAMAQAQLDELPFSDEVREQVGLLEAARAKAEAVRYLDLGDYEGASQVLSGAQTDFMMERAPASPEMAREVEALRTLKGSINAGQVKLSRKFALFQSHARSRSLHQSGSSEYYLRQFKKEVKHRLAAVLGDITEQQVDAIVNSTSPDYSGTGGLDGAIHAAAGPQLRQACEKLLPCQPGEARITPGYNLPAKWVIHTVTPDPNQGQSAKTQQLAQCYRNCLELAQQNNVQTLAIPAIGTLGCPLDVAAKIAIETVVMFLKQQDTPQQVLFVCFDKEAYQHYRQAIV